MDRNDGAEALAPAPADADAAEAPAPADATTDVPPDDEPDLDVDEPPPPPELVLVGAFDDTLPSNMQLLLATGQAAVAEAFVPTAGRPGLVRAHVQAPPIAPGATACGRYRAVWWSPRDIDPEGGGASFDLLPDLIGPEVLVPVPAGAKLTLDLPLVDPDAPPSAPPLAGVAPHRFGARYVGPCAGALQVPWIRLDASADNAHFFIWAETWIPGTDLQLPGRWGLLLGLSLAP